MAHLECEIAMTPNGYSPSGQAADTVMLPRSRATYGVVGEDPGCAECGTAAVRNVEAGRHLLDLRGAIAEVMSADVVRKVRNWNKRRLLGRAKFNKVIPGIRQAVAENNHPGKGLNECRRH